MNSSKRPSNKVSKRKTSKNTVGVQQVDGMIRLSLPREISRSAYNVRQKFIFPGLAATPLNLKLMEAKANQISADIATGNFQISWEKYELGVTATNKLVALDGGKKTEPTLLELWERFKEYKRPTLAETTYMKIYENRHTKAIVEAIQKTDGEPISIRNQIADRWCEEIAKGVLSILEKAYQWGIQHEIVTKNPYLGMAEGISTKRKKTENNKPFDEFEDTRAFNTEEMNAIIGYFETTPNVSCWTNYVKFLFWTGCRPGEASALRWNHISPDCSVIKFQDSYDARTKITKDTKTGTDRIFPCHTKLKNLLLSIKSNQVNKNDLVFRNRLGKHIGERDFGRMWGGRKSKNKYGKTYHYKGVIEILIEKKIVRTYLKPYATRHTFITHQVDADKAAHIIAAWVGNSADIIWKHYCQHKQGESPAEM